MSLKFSQSLLISFAFLFFSSANGQIKITVKGSKDYAALWNNLTIRSKDTNIEISFDAMKGATFKGLKEGTYHIVLQSVFNRSVSKDIDLKQQASVQFNVENIYNAFKDTTSLLDLMRDGDTTHIYYLPGGAWAKEKGYFMLIKEGSAYHIVLRNERNDWLSSKSISAEDVSELRLLLKYKKGVNTDIANLGKYYCALSNKVLLHDCGSCMFGFILRKHLVKSP